MKENLLLLGKIAGAAMALISICAFFGKPFLEDYVHEQIDLKFEAVKAEAEANKRPSFRSLLSKSMKVDEDEVHVRIGDMYKQEGDIKKEIKYYHPSTLLDN